MDNNLKTMHNLNQEIYNNNKINSNIRSNS